MNSQHKYKAILCDDDEIIATGLSEFISWDDLNIELCGVGFDGLEAKELIEKGIISGGMLPKIQNCIDAINKGVSRVHIMDGRIPHGLLLEIFTNKGIGTAIIKENEEKYWNE